MPGNVFRWDEQMCTCFMIDIVRLNMLVHDRQFLRLNMLCNFVRGRVLGRIIVVEISSFAEHHLRCVWSRQVETLTFLVCSQCYKREERRCFCKNQNVLVYILTEQFGRITVLAM